MVCFQFYSFVCATFAGHSLVELRFFGLTAFQEIYVAVLVTDLFWRDLRASQRLQFTKFVITLFSSH